MKSDIKGNAHRLAYTLYQFAEDKRVIQMLSQILHYNPEQLQEDMAAIDKYINQLERGSKNDD